MSESFVFRTKISAEEKRKSDIKMNAMRKAAKEKLTPKQLLLSNLYYFYFFFKLKDHLHVIL